MPIWYSSDEPVQYIVTRMTLPAKTDGLELPAKLADTTNENVESKIYNILEKKLNYSDVLHRMLCKIVTNFHGLLGDRK